MSVPPDVLSFIKSKVEMEGYSASGSFNNPSSFNNYHSSSGSFNNPSSFNNYHSSSGSFNNYSSSGSFSNYNQRARGSSGSLSNYGPSGSFSNYNRRARGGKNKSRRSNEDRSQQDNDINSPSNWVPVGKQNPLREKSRCPPHLRGRDIGMWHARNSRGNSKKTKEGRNRLERRDIGDRAVITLNQEDEQNITTLLSDVKANKEVDERHSQGCSYSYEQDSESNSMFFPLPYETDFKPNMPIDDPTLDNELYLQLQRNHSTANQYGPTTSYQKIQNFRRQLPSFKMQEQIIDMVKNNQVSLISGETGCGKTTQVCQFILDDYIKRKCGSRCHIVCTQPRRISAISVAERVSAERNETIGRSCGYQIRLEHKLPRKQGSILFCTVGVLLRFMIRDPSIVKASHIVIDEIHERDTLSDFLLVIIKDLLPFRPELKIILMSATLNAEIFSNYFGNCPVLEIPGRSYFVQEYYLEDIFGMISYQPNDPSRKKTNWSDYKNKSKKDEDYFKYLTSIEATYQPNVISTLREMQFNTIDHDLVIAVVHHICQISQDGAILIFVPGWQDISKINQCFNQSAVFSNDSNFIIIPLHSKLPTVSQREVFERPPAGCRKIIIATNIAETSITIDDVVYVVDCGKAREKNFNRELNVSSLDSCWISKASEKQRRGRAGRVQDGFCFHLFTLYHHAKFREFQLPEMLRTPLDTLCLQIKLLKLGKMWPFLSKAIEPPELATCELAIKELTQMRALDANENLTSLGYYLALLPVSPKIGRMILFGAMFSCLDPILTVASSLESKDPFFSPLGKEKEADKSKRMLSNGSKSDHIALINAFIGWEVAKRENTEASYCYTNFLSKSHLYFIAGIKNQFAQLLNEIGFIKSTNPKNMDHNGNSENINLIKAVICAGLYPNVAKIEYNFKGTRIQSIHTVGDEANQLRVELHPKSVNFKEKQFESQWLIYHEKMKIAKVFIFDSTMVSPYPLLFFGGQIRYHDERGVSTIEVDSGIKFHSTEQIANLVMDLRLEIDKLLGKKIKNPSMPLVIGHMNESDDEKILKAVIDLITSEKVSAWRLFSEPF